MPALWHYRTKPADGNILTVLNGTVWKSGCGSKLSIGVVKEVHVIDCLFSFLSGNATNWSFVRVTTVAGDSGVLEATGIEN